MFIAYPGCGEEPSKALVRASRAPAHSFWPEVLRYNGLTDFEALWNLEIPWYEPINRARGGWSGVARFELDLPGGGRSAVFIKRQQNYRSRTLSHPLRGEATLAREWRNLQRLRACGIPAQQPVYFAQRYLKGRLQAILITEALDNHAPLDVLLRRWQTPEWINNAAQARLLDSLAAAISRIHEHFICHGCLYPKHILVSETGSGAFDIRIIDLEKARLSPFRLFAAIRDLDQFKRHATAFGDEDWRRFFQRYFRDWRPAVSAQWALAGILKRVRRKNGQNA